MIEYINDDRHHLDKNNFIDNMFNDLCKKIYFNYEYNNFKF